MKPSELIKVLQKAVDAGQDDNTDIFFDTEVKAFNYHMAKISSAWYEPEAFAKPLIILQEDR
jgi:hypothetical protein